MKIVKPRICFIDHVNYGINNCFFNDYKIILDKRVMTFIILINLLRVIIFLLYDISIVYIFKNRKFLRIRIF